MQRCSNSWRVRNLFVVVLRLNKLAETIGSLHTRLLRPSTNFCLWLHCILHSLDVVDNTRENHFPLPPIFMPSHVHPRLLGT